ncbi:hypothetical protein L210DRAFT_2785863 [Boletus edulis BED1]|uniref:Uncharacterized protein n=1 Tax=Boletus edulis BED1 TaxID=1328754 RepID=A0AAD4C300_BOLED|nr:hypothetical protein L210DRAFT_2785863 [Boletus edulis BED1]
MGGEGPYVRFLNDSEDGSQNSKASPARPPLPLNDKQLDETYARAHAFLLKRVEQLVQLGWEQHETDDALLAFLSYTRFRPEYTSLVAQRSRVELRLPRTASAWFEPSFIPQWKTMFERSALFETRRHGRGSSTSDRYADVYLYVDVEFPLQDIFNFFQCLMPDMLVIIRVDDIDDIEESETTQRLPSPRWIEEYAEELCSIFGEERFKAVAEASRTCNSVSHMLTTYYDRYDSESEKDFTACDKECGYCGRCDY